MDKSFLTIDQGRLDVEWVNQPLLLYDYSMQLADARLDLDNAKNQHEALEADLRFDIVNDPKAYGVDKGTEKELSAILVQQVPFQSSLKKINKAKHRVDVLYAAVNALDHRKKALENLVSLHGQQYFATPRAKGTPREHMSEEVKREVRSLGRRREFE